MAVVTFPIVARSGTVSVAYARMPEEVAFGILGSVCQQAGTIDINLNTIGNGDGLAAKDFTIATSVIYKSFNNIDNVEELISPP